MNKLSTKYLLSKDTSESLQEALDNLEILFMSGYFGTGIQSTKYLLTTQIWKTPKEGEQYRRLVSLNKLFHLALKRSVEAYEDEPSYTLEELQKWAKQKSDKTLRSLVTIDPMPDKPFGERWDSEFLDKLPLEKNSPDVAWKDGYGYITTEIDAILKDRLKNRLGIEDTISYMYSKMTSGMGSLGQELFEEEIKNNPLLSKMFSSDLNPPDIVTNESKYATTLSIEKLEILFLRLLKLQAPAPYQKDIIDTLFIVHYLLDNKIDNVLEFYQKSMEKLYKPTLDALFEWLPMMQFYATQKLGILYGISKKEVKSYPYTLEKRESEGTRINDSFDVKYFDWKKIIDNYSKIEIDEEYRIDYNKDYFEKASDGLTLISTTKKLTSSKGVTEEEIDTTQKRLGLSLPPSYISFLKETNGMLIPTEFFDLFPIEDIDFFNTLEPEWVEAWYDEEDDTEDEKYNIYGIDQDPVWMRSSYLKDVIQISNTLEGDVLLLNPRVKFGQEWEAWHFGNKIPGAYRYKSFAQMMDAIFARVHDE